MLVSSRWLGCNYARVLSLDWVQGTREETEGRSLGIGRYEVQTLVRARGARGADRTSASVCGVEIRAGRSGVCGTDERASASGPRPARAMAVCREVALRARDSVGPWRGVTGRVGFVPVLTLSGEELVAKVNALRVRDASRGTEVGGLGRVGV